MSFQFNAAGSPEEVIAQLMTANTGNDALGEDLRDLLLKHLKFPKITGPQDRYVLAVQAAGSTSLGALTTLQVETQVFWVPYVRAGTAEKARLHLEEAQRVPEGD